MKQLFLSLDEAGKEWVINVTFDAAYAFPESRNDVDTPQPQREWLLTLTDEKHLRLRQETEKFLRESLAFTHGGEKLPYQISFPDYEESPPNFPSMLTGGAYINVRLTGIIPPMDGGKEGGAFHIFLLPGKRPDFVIGAGDQEARIYHVLTPGKDKLLFETSAKHDRADLHQGNDTDFITMGYTHVLPKGLDHVLFIFSLFLMARAWRPLLSLSLTFTLAHTITLGLVATGVIHIAPWAITWLIEPLIAFSIVFVALENLFLKKWSRWQLMMVFIFGLVHGLGFAGSLGTALDHQSHRSLTPLVLANLGVELAQITILLIAWVATIGWWKTPYYQKFRIACSLLITAIGIFWIIDRLTP